MTLHLLHYDTTPTRFTPMRAWCGKLVSAREVAKSVDEVTCETCKARSDAHDRAEV